MANLQNIVTHLCIIVFRYCLMAVFIQQCFGALTFGIVRISEEFELSQFQLTEYKKGLNNGVKSKGNQSQFELVGSSS